MKKTCWMVMVAGVLAGPANAATGDGLPPPIASALEHVAAVVERPAPDPATADAQLAAAIRELAGAVPALEESQLAEYVQAKMAVVTPAIVQRARAGKLEAGELVDALEELRRATEEQAAVVLRGADGPDHDCITDVVLCFGYCSRLDTPTARAACAIGCEIDLVVCMNVLFPGPKRPGGGGLSVVDH